MDLICIDDGDSKLRKNTKGTPTERKHSNINICLSQHRESGVLVLKVLKINTLSDCIVNFGYILIFLSTDDASN